MWHHTAFQPLSKKWTNANSIGHDEYHLWFVRYPPSEEIVSLNVEVKRNGKCDNNKDDEDDPSYTMMRLHAYFTGISSFSLRGAPTSNEITQLLVEYFDVDEFNRQLKVPSKVSRVAKIRAESISIWASTVAAERRPSLALLNWMRRRMRRGPDGTTPGLQIKE